MHIRLKYSYRVFFNDTQNKTFALGELQELILLSSDIVSALSLATYLKNIMENTHLEFSDVAAITRWPYTEVRFHYITLYTLPMSSILIH